MKRICFVVLVMCAVAAFPPAAFAASPEVFLVDEPEIYLAIDKLEGYGLLRGMMTGDRGLETREVAREAWKAGTAEDAFTEGLLQVLRMEGAQRGDFRLRAGIGYDRHGEVPDNGQGLPLPKGTSFRAGGFFRASAFEWLALQGRGDYVKGQGDTSTGRVEETSIRLGWPAATLEAGRFSLWWGPGRRGALLFTTNAQPLIGVRLRNPRPFTLGKWLGFLGLFQYDLFVSRLEKEKAIPNTLLAGMRFALKPGPHFEIGVSRAMHFGGEGKTVDASTVWDVIAARKENDPSGPGNQLISFDAKTIFRAGRQPVVVYGEAGAEDHSGPFTPSKWAWLGGFFLPSIGANGKIDFRFEFADTHDSAHGIAVWYRHTPSHEAYAHTYHGQILGHPDGTDARDFFAEAHYFFLPTSFLEFNADLKQRFFAGLEQEETVRLGSGLILWLTKNWRSETRFAVAKVSNENGTVGADRTDLSFQFILGYQYRGF